MHDAGSNLQARASPFRRTTTRSRGLRSCSMRWLAPGKPGPIPDHRWNADQPGRRHRHPDLFRLVRTVEYHHCCQRHVRPSERRFVLGWEHPDSAPVTIVVNNPAPSVTVTIPTSGATKQANNLLFDAAAPPGVTNVVFNATGEGLPFGNCDPDHLRVDSRCVGGTGGRWMRFPTAVFRSGRCDVLRRGQRNSAPVSFILDDFRLPVGVSFNRTRLSPKRVLTR